MISPLIGWYGSAGLIVPPNQTRAPPEIITVPAGHEAVAGVCEAAELATGTVVARTVTERSANATGAASTATPSTQRKQSDERTRVRSPLCGRGAVSPDSVAARSSRARKGEEAVL